MKYSILFILFIIILIIFLLYIYFYIYIIYTKADIPVLVLANKNDLEKALTVEETIEKLDLKSISGNREICCYSISAKNYVNIDITLQWLTKVNITELTIII